MRTHSGARRVHKTVPYYAYFQLEEILSRQELLDALAWLHEHKEWADLWFTQAGWFDNSQQYSLVRKRLSWGPHY